MNLITFSTLACPHWGIETVIARAVEYGYDGIEWRGGPEGHIQPTMPAEHKQILQKMMTDTGLIVIALTAYTSFASPSAKERRSNVDELMRYTDLAAELDAPYVRTFLGELPEGTKPDPSLYRNISDCLGVAAEYAESVGVKIAVEPHDDFVRSSTVAPIFNQPQPQDALRVIWDLGNAFAAGEEPGEGYDLLKDHLAYVQVKDGKGHAPDWQLCPLGEGDIPLAKAFDLLMADDYPGAFSVEWEYAWHPELDPPEVALPAALRTVRKLLTSALPESA